MHSKSPKISNLTLSSSLSEAERLILKFILKKIKDTSCNSIDFEKKELFSDSINQATILETLKSLYSKKVSYSIVKDDCTELMVYTNIIAIIIYGLETDKVTIDLPLNITPVLPLLLEL